MSRIVLVACLLSFSAFPAEITVKAGESIQDAIDNASPGDILRIAPDTYTEPFTIRTDGITILGKTEHDRAIFDAQSAHLEMIRIEANDVRVEGFVVRNGMAGGIVVYKSNRVKLADVVVEDNSYIGINIAESIDVTVDRAAVAGHESAGILIAQSQQVNVFASNCFDNLTGIRIENTAHFLLENNALYRNSTGIALVSLPNRATPSSAYGRVLYNWILDNNRDASPDPGTVDAAMIPGVGIYIVAADNIEVAYNRLERNSTYASIAVGLQHSALPGASESESHTNHLYLHHNRYSDNGSNPSPQFSRIYPGQPAGDLYWDGNGERNQWQESGEFKTVPDNLVQQQGGAHTNVIHFI